MLNEERINELQKFKREFEGSLALAMEKYNNRNDSQENITERRKLRPIKLKKKLKVKI